MAISLYHLRILTYVYEAEQVEKNRVRSWLNGMEKKFFTEKESDIVGEVKNVEEENIYYLMDYDDAAYWVKEEIKKIRREKPLATIDFSFNEYTSRGYNKVIFKKAI